MGVRLGARRHVAAQHALLAARKRQRQRLDDRRADRILNLEHVLERHLERMRPQHRAGGNLDRVCTLTRTWPPAWSIEPVTTASTFASVATSADRAGRSLSSRRGQARADDQRFQARQRHGNRVRQAERQEVDRRLRPQDAERQHDQTRRRARHDRSPTGRPRERQSRRSRAMSSADLIALVRRLHHRALDHAVGVDDGRAIQRARADARAGRRAAPRSATRR